MTSSYRQNRTSSYRQNRTRLFLPVKAVKTSLRLLSRNGYLILLNLTIGNSPVETFLSSKLKLMRLGRYLLPGHSLIRFRSMKYSKQQSGIKPLFC